MNINKYLNMLLVQQKTEVLSLAIELQIFTLIEKKNYEIQDLSLELSTNSHNTKTLLDSLVLLDLLYKENGFYKNEEISKRFFISNSSTYCGDVFLHRKNMLEYGKESLSSLLKKEHLNLNKPKDSGKWANAAKKYLKQEQKNLISPSALNIIKNLRDINKMKKILDLGCSSGIVGLEIVKNYENMTGVLFDYKEVTNIANNHIREYDLENRVSILSGDIEEDNIGEGYDLIWCSNILYFFKDKKKILEKIYKALNPNGVLVSCHVEIDEQDKVNQDSFFYFLFMSMQERNIIKPMELSNICEDIGFKNIYSFSNFDMPMTPCQIHIARK